MMTFSEFAQRMYSVIGEGSSASAFASSLLDSIVSYEDDLHSPLQELGSSAFKAYFYGFNKITKTAKKINRHVETAEFEIFINNLPDNAVQALSKIFQDEIPDITPQNAGQKLAELFESIIFDAARTKRRTSIKKSEKEASTSSAHDELAEKVLASGDALTKAFAGIEEKLAADKNAQNDSVLMPDSLSDDDKELLRQFKKDVKDILKYCIDEDPTAVPIKVTLTDEIHDACRKWQYDMREIDNSDFRKLVIDTTQTLTEYSYYISDVFMQLMPGTDMLWFKNGSAEEGNRLRDVFHPKSQELRLAIAELYKRLYPIPGDTNYKDTETVDAEVVDENASDTADVSGDGIRTQIINNPTIVNQYGEKNIHIDHVKHLEL